MHVSCPYLLGGDHTLRMMSYQHRVNFKNLFSIKNLSHFLQASIYVLTVLCLGQGCIIICQIQTCNLSPSGASTSM